MKMTEYEALQIILDLATENMLTGHYCDSRELKREMKKQEKALAIIENLSNNLKMES